MPVKNAGHIILPFVACGIWVNVFSVHHHDPRFTGNPIESEIANQNERRQSDLDPDS